VPVEPPAVPWSFPHAADLAAQDLDDLVAVGADLAPGTLLAAYRAGLFPMPSGGGDMQWWCPDPRGVLALDSLVVSRSLRRSCRDFEIRVDSAFGEVISECADPRRSQGWIDSGVEAAYRRLHELGWAHSVEAWQDDVLVGGLYGVAVGGLFAGESMFHRVTDASKVALVGLVDIMSDGRHRLLDVQWCTPHLASLGVVEVSRQEYLAGLPALLRVPLPTVFDGPAQL
jgi:leucyl/phenylalanyl-tRNA---protein transferase